MGGEPRLSGSEGGGRRRPRRAFGNAPSASITMSNDEFAYKRDAKLQARLTAEVDALAKLPGNQQCADCNETKRIRFCSVTLGVFLCNRCYGLHRALGAHVTRGKCLGLDAWKPEEVDLLRNVGNVRAKAIYEAAVPPDQMHPSASSSDREVAAWIKAKYEQKKFYVPTATPQTSLQPAGSLPLVSAAPLAVAPARATAATAATPATPPMDDLLGDLMIVPTPAQAAPAALPPTATDELLLLDGLGIWGDCARSECGPCVLDLCFDLGRAPRARAGAFPRRHIAAGCHVHRPS